MSKRPYKLILRTGETSREVLSAECADRIRHVAPALAQTLPDGAEMVLTGPKGTPSETYDIWTGDWSRSTTP